MGKIWLQTNQGKLIHMPIVGADYNTPDSAIKVPTAAIHANIANRCLDGQVTVTHPQYGTVTFDFGAPGRTGSCNQCGQCCTHPIASCPHSSGNCGYVLDAARGVHKCQYLSILPKGLGKANGTECSVRSSILDIAKGCTLFPSKAEEMLPHMTACGFSFGA